MSQPSKRKAEIWRESVGFSLLHWRRFLDITRDEADELLKLYPGYTWPVIPPDEKQRVHKNINRRLREEGISEVGEDLVKWRMGIAVQSRKAGLAGQPLGSEASPPAVNETNPGPEASASHPYDPVKDAIMQHDT